MEATTRGGRTSDRNNTSRLIAVVAVEDGQLVGMLVVQFCVARRVVELYNCYVLRIFNKK